MKELETALLNDDADIAVHSMKDVPGQLPDGLAISAICERADSRDALISNRYSSLGDLPGGAVIGSSSLRRRFQIRNQYPALGFKELRGNVDTRIRKLDEGQYDGIVLAVAGLDRLGLSRRIVQKIPTNICLPAAGQGAVGVESKTDKTEVLEITRSINDENTEVCVLAERAVTLSLGATCNLPIASHATIELAEDGEPVLNISAFVSDMTGDNIITRAIEGKVDAAMTLALELGRQLIELGALALIEQSHRK